MSDLGNNGSAGQKNLVPEVRLNARPVSRGIAIGRVVCLYGENRQFFRTSIKPEKVSKEIDRFHSAHQFASRQLKKIGEKSADKLGNSATIFDVHLAILEDSSLKDKIEETISNDLVNAEWAVKLVTDEYIAKYCAIPDEHFRDRYIDVEDIAEQLQTALGGGKRLIRLAKDSIIVAKELRPSTLAELSHEDPLAIVSENGGWTSHTFILARELDLPAVTGVKKLMRRVKTGDTIIVDGYDGRIILNPEPSTVEEFRATEVGYSTTRPVEPPMTGGAIKTLDGREIKIRANFDIPDSFHRAKRLGAQGIGLFRSEYLFNRFKGFPGEAEQMRAYREIADYAGKHRARIRTFDLSIDQTADHGSRREKNPALGLRAIRLGLAVPRQMRTQIRALLQASFERDIDIILPMVSGVDEIRRVKAIISLEADRLRHKGTEIGAPRLGAMIEVPSAILTVKQILEEVDCLLLGTNDLVQYLLGVDRDNESVAGWFRTLHPAVLSSLKMVIEAANLASKPLVICGEMAGSPFYIPILIGLGATELSMNVNSIMRVRRIVSGIAHEEARELASLISVCTTADEVEHTVEEFIGQRWSHLFKNDLRRRL